MFAESARLYPGPCASIAIRVTGEVTVTASRTACRTERQEMPTQEERDGQERQEGMMRATMNPLAETTGIDPDADLVTLAQSGSRDALEELVARHQAWIYNIALRMIYDPHDAEDVTQEILIKLVTKLSTFEGRSRFRTWLYRLVVNHVLNMKRTRAEEFEWTFEKYGSGLRS